MEKNRRIKVGISIGDLNGIGGEVILKSLSNNKILEEFDFDVVIFASVKNMNYYKKIIGEDAVNIFEVKDTNNLKSGRINVINVWNEHVDIKLGIPSDVSAEYSLKSLKEAIYSLKQGNIDCLVTAPVDKNNIAKLGVDFKGHTEYLESILGGNSLMIMSDENIKIALATNHIPVHKIKECLSKDLIENKLTILNDSLKNDFNISSPKIAVLGLNPHCGDNGLIGNEENDIISPAIKNSYTKNKINVFGPFSSDSFFASPNYKKYDAILAMYHDQGLIPFKILTEYRGINFTAGLDKIRTSPSHGTAFDIAGKGVADNRSFLEAIFAAVNIFKNRNS